MHHLPIKKVFMTHLLTQRSLLGVAVISAALLSGCGGSDGGSYKVSNIESISVPVRNATENTVIPDIENFATQAKQLDSEVTDFCGTPTQIPTQTELEALQNTFKDTALAWHRIAMYNFGPLHHDILFPRIHRIESMRQRGTDYSQSIRNDLNAFLDDTSLQNDFSNKTFQYVGLLPIEIGLFENHQTGQTTTESILDHFQQTPRKCTYLIGLTSELKNQADTILYEWQVNYPHETSTGNLETSYQDLLLNEGLSDGIPTANRYIVAIQEHLDYIKNRKLYGTLDGQLSGLTYLQIFTSLEAIEDFMSAQSTDDYRFFEHMQALGDTQALETVKSNLARAKQFAQQQDRQQLAIALGELDGNFKREVPDALGVTLGINFSDGD